MSKRRPGQDNRWYIGQCIYCGESARPLSDEHVVPHALNGEWVLEDASCEACSRITSRFELDVCRAFLPYARAWYRLRTRRKHPSSFPLVVVRDGKEETISLTPEEYGAVLVVPHLRMPAYLDQRPSDKYIRIIDAFMARIGGLEVDEINRRYGATEVHFSITHKPGDLVRFLAKVAYGVAAARAVEHGGLAEVARLRAASYVLPLILGHDDDADMWVGATPPEQGPETHEIVRVQLQEISGDIVARIRLFGGVVAPTYVVVIGRVPGT